MGSRNLKQACLTPSGNDRQTTRIQFICACILSRPDRNVTELDLRWDNTSFQLKTILEENHHSVLIQGTNP